MLEMLFERLIFWIFAAAILFAEAQPFVAVVLALLATATLLVLWVHNKLWRFVLYSISNR
jgi:hypothetical protein